MTQRQCTNYITVLQHMAFYYFNVLKPNGRNLWLHRIAFNNDLVIYMVALFKINKLATSGLFGLDS